MNKHNFNQTGLYPLNTERLQELQTSFSVFNQLGWAIGNYAILSGCENNSGVVTNGYVFVDGEVYPFVGGNVQTSVRILKTNVDRGFKNGSVKTVYESYFVTFASGAGSIPWANFKKPDTLLNLLDRVTNAETALEAAVTKLATIEEGAEVNVQPDFNISDNTLDSFIKNKPNLAAFLMKGSYTVGNLASTDVDLTVTFDSVGTSNYMVVGSLVSQSANYNDDNDVIWSVKSKSAGSFRLLLREVSVNNQNLTFNYALIPL